MLQHKVFDQGLLWKHLCDIPTHRLLKIYHDNFYLHARIIWILT